jgi:hypothetical protein
MILCRKYGVSFDCSGENVEKHWGNVDSREMMGLIGQVLLEMSIKQDHVDFTWFYHST